MGFLRALQEEEIEEQEETKLLEKRFLSTSNYHNNSNSYKVISNCLPIFSQLEEQFMDSNSNKRPQQQQQQQQQQPEQQNMRIQTYLQEHQSHQPHHQIPYGISSSSSSPIPPNFISKDGIGAYDLGELDQALFLYFDGQDPASSNVQHNSSGSMRSPPTLNIFPSRPMHVEPSPTNVSTVLISQAANSSDPNRAADHSSMDKAMNIVSGSGPEPAKSVKRESGRKLGPTSSSEQEAPKTPDPKTLRRLAQNREAARKSRLRKKAYVQQLESSRIKLSQLEQELQRARSQGMFFGGGALIGGDQQGLPIGINNISTEAAVFDMEYARWMEEQNRLLCELRAAVQEHLAENELRLFVENIIAHYDAIVNLKSMAAKSDVFHLFSGMWKTPAERCFMWMGGFRPSEIIKIVVGPIEPLTEQQILGICGLQQSTQEAEEVLSQGLEALNQSLMDTIASDSLSIPLNMPNYMGQMAMAINKLSTLEDFLRQGDNLRQQTIHRLVEILTTRQAAKCMLAMAEYFHRLRALSSLWLVRPRQE